MKKLVVIHKNLSHPYTGGQYRLAQVINFLKKKDVNYHIIDCGQLPERTKRNRFLFILHFLKFYLTSHKKIFTFVNHGIHFRLLLPLFISRLRGNTYGVNSNQTFYNFRRNIFLRLLEFICEYIFLHGASLLVIPSRPALQYFKHLRIEDKPRVIVNPAPKVVGKNKAEFRNRVHNLIFVGQVRWWKGLDTLIAAFVDVRELDLHLDVVGHYDAHSRYIRTIMNTINRNRLEDRVTFHGNVSAHKLADLYEKADIFILPSRYETFGIVLLEAMSYGLPIITSCIPSAQEIIQEEVNGIFYETENPQSLADAIRRLHADPTLRESIHNNNVRTSKTSRTWEMVANETLNALEKFLV
jgi:glycosyltransferase involved in cell wall biosynthesis